jgi:FHA domain
MTATFACPNGHQSTTDDYCDQCGARIAPGSGAAAPGSGAAAPGSGAAAPGSGAAAVSVAPAGGATAAAAAGQLCPACGAARVGSDRFCEGCGYDFVTQTTPAEAAAAGQTGTGQAASEALWEAIISADRAYFDQVATPGVVFPPHCPDRTFPLVGAQLRIGRRSASRGIYPEIDLSGAPEDSAVSHLHALLVPVADGSYTLVDPGSTNGTTVNDNPDPIAVNTPVPLADGDRIHVGAWTTITIHSRPKPGS